MSLAKGWRTSSAPLQSGQSREPALPTKKFEAAIAKAVLNFYKDLRFIFISNKPASHFQQQQGGSGKDKRNCLSGKFWPERQACLC